MKALSVFHNASEITIMAFRNNKTMSLYIKGESGQWHGHVMLKWRGRFGTKYIAIKSKRTIEVLDRIVFMHLGELP